MLLKTIYFYNKKMTVWLKKSYLHQINEFVKEKKINDIKKLIQENGITGYHLHWYNESEIYKSALIGNDPSIIEYLFSDEISGFIFPDLSYNHFEIIKNMINNNIDGLKFLFTILINKYSQDLINKNIPINLIKTFSSNINDFTFLTTKYESLNHLTLNEIKLLYCFDIGNNILSEQLLLDQFRYLILRASKDNQYFDELNFIKSIIGLYGTFNGDSIVNYIGYLLKIPSPFNKNNLIPELCYECKIPFPYDPNNNSNYNNKDIAEIIHIHKKHNINNNNNEVIDNNITKNNKDILNSITNLEISNIFSTPTNTVNNNNTDNNNNNADNNNINYEMIDYLISNYYTYIDNGISYAKLKLEILKKLVLVDNVKLVEILISLPSTKGYIHMNYDSIVNLTFNESVKKILLNETLGKFCIQLKQNNIQYLEFLLQHNSKLNYLTIKNYNNNQLIISIN